MIHFQESVQGVAVLRVTSRDFTLNDKKTFLSTIEPYLNSHSLLLLDMSDVLNLDGYGVATLLECLNAFRAKGGDLKLANVAEPVRDMLQIARLRRVFECYDSVPQALASYGIPVPLATSADYADGMLAADGDD